MSKTLPPEIIRPVVIHLKNDKTSLHSCTLVSRDWCRETVDLLWRQPFHFLYTCSSPIYNCSEEKQLSQANNLLSTYLSIKYNDELVKEGIIKTKGRNTIFNYFDFLSALDLNELYFAIIDFANYLKSKSNNVNTFDNTPLVEFNDILKCFLTYSPKLKLLSFDTGFTLHKTNNSNACLSHRSYNIANIADYKILDNLYNLLSNESKIPEVEQFFANLNELVFTTEERKSEVFSCLSRICYNIQKLIVKVRYTIFSGMCGTGMMSMRRNASYESKQLVSLIRSQHNLVYFELIGNDDEGACEILKSLKETQYKSLKTLIFNNVFINNFGIILNYLKYLQNLQELRFNECTRSTWYQNNNNEEKYHDWEDLWLPNLKHLEVNFVDKYKDDSEKLYSILLRCSPYLINDNGFFYK